ISTFLYYVTVITMDYSLSLHDALPIFGGVAWLLWCLPQAGRRPLRDFLSAQWVATLGLLPLTVILFGQASLAGPLANLAAIPWRSEEHTSELQSRENLVCRLLLEKKHT